MTPEERKALSNIIVALSDIEDSAREGRRCRDYCITDLEEESDKLIRLIEDMIGPQLTRWDLITPAEREALSLAKFNGRCSGCNEYLETEEDFARHFIVSNKQFKNLGECPKKMRERRKAAKPVI